MLGAWRTIGLVAGLAGTTIGACRTSGDSGASASGGDGPPLAPPTDPTVGYPPGYTGVGGPGPTEGFNYTVLGGVYSGSEVDLQIDIRELWKKWCQLQTPYPYYSEETANAEDGGCGTLWGYGCLPNVAEMGGGSAPCAWSACGQPAWTPIDCGRLNLCAGLSGAMCTCTSTSCTVPVGPTGGTSFNMQLAAGVLDGTTAGFEQGVLDVHLTKVAGMDGGDDGEAGCVTLTVIDAPASHPACNISVAGGASLDATQTICVAPGTTVSLTAEPYGASWILGPDPWHDTSGDTGSGDPGTVMGGVSATTVVVTSTKTCVWACCPFENGTECPTTDPCP